MFEFKKSPTFKEDFKNTFSVRWLKNILVIRKISIMPNFMMS